MKIKDLVNKFNILADKKTYGRWKEFNTEYFSDIKTIEALYSLFMSSNVQIQNECSIVEFGSAEGMVGEFFNKKLSVNHNVQLTIVDVVAEHVRANNNPETEKVVQDLLRYSEKEKFDLAIARSLLHYFSVEEQSEVLYNIFNSLKPGGHFLIQAFIQNENDLDLFLRLNHFVGKKLQLVSAYVLNRLVEQAGFVDIKILGNAPTWNCGSENLKRRYSLSDSDLKKMREMIVQADENQKQGFQLKENGFTVPVPFKVLLAHKPL